MSPEPARHLHVVDADTGERLDSCPECARRDDEITGLQRALAAESRRYEDLKRDKDAEARAHQLWPKAQAIFAAWRTATNHPRAVWTADRFWVIEPFLRKPEYGVETCLRAVAGIAFDHFSVPRKNGSIRRFDEFERCFKDSGSVEERANAAPRGWRERPEFAEVLARFAELPNGNRTQQRPAGEARR